MADGAAPTGANAELINDLGGERLIMAQLELNSAMADVTMKGEQLGEAKRKNEELMAALEAQGEDTSDIYFYLHQKLDDNYEVIDKLEKEKEKLEREKVKDLERFARQAEEAVRDHEGKTRHLQDRVEELEDENTQLKDFKERKQELEDDMVRLEQELQVRGRRGKRRE